MGNCAGTSADLTGLTDYDAGQPSLNAPAQNSAPRTPVSGSVSSNGQPVPFTLQTAPIAPEAYRWLPEQIVIASLLLISFFVPLFHLFG